MGRFFNGRVKKDRTSLIKYCVIGVGVLIIIILLCAIGCKKQNDYTSLLKLKDEGLTIEVGDSLPDPKDFFKEYDTEYPYIDTLTIENNDECDTFNIGECDITITGIDIKDFKTKLYIKDTTAPELEVKESISIETKAKYKAEDFVLSCYDNYDEDCKIHFYDEDVDDDGEEIDYSSYKEEGTYDIKVVAEDSSGNISTPADSKLIITGVQQPEEPEEPEEPEKPEEPETKCQYGDLTVNSNRIKFPIAVIVGDQKNNCAANRDIWDQEDTQASANELFNADYNRLQQQMYNTLKQNFPNGANIKVYPNYISVLNDSLTGLVGYGIYIKVYVANLDEQLELDENMVMSYYIKSDGTRQYTTNKYNIGE